MDPKAQKMVVVGLIGVALVCARRWKNDDREAGMVVAGLTLFIILLMT